MWLAAWRFGARVGLLLGLRRELLGRSREMERWERENFLN
ncbi:MAG: hypothetical protein KatS3mg070_2259 [Meiothermus sp.]|nr:MAG: hypothetical protein KatS3mg070_2259 [Meiothermus sp.]